jgi:hypothetical protein
MSDTAIAADLYQPLDIHLDSLAQVALYITLTLNDCADAREFLFRQLAHLLARQLPRIPLEALSGLFQYSARPRTAYPVDVGETYLRSLVIRQVYAGNACHISSK